MSDKKPKKGPEPLKAYVAFKQKVTYASSRRSPSPVTSVPIASTTPVRGLSPVQSYLQSQWPRDIRNSLSVNVESTQTEPIVSQTLDNDENAESCENCIIKSLTEEGTALRELKRIRQAKITKKPTQQQQQQQRPPSVENCSDELMAYQEPDDYVRVLMTPMDGRRPPRPSSVDSQTQTEEQQQQNHACSPCHSPVKSIRLHPPSPGTNRSFLFKREPPDGAEVVKPSFENNTTLKMVKAKDQNAKIKSCFKPSPNSTFVQYKPQHPAS